MYLHRFRALGRGELAAAAAGAEGEGQEEREDQGAHVFPLGSFAQVLHRRQPGCHTRIRPLIRRYHRLRVSSAGFPHFSQVKPSTLFVAIGTPARTSISTVAVVSMN